MSSITAVNPTTATLMKNKFKLTAISLCLASCLPAVGFADSDKSNET